jgi:hypothetical protein
MTMSATSRYRWALDRRGAEAALLEITEDVRAIREPLDVLHGRLFHPLPEEQVRTRILARAHVPADAVWLPEPVDPWPASVAY